MPYPPTSVSLATRVLFLGAFLSAISGVMALIDSRVPGGVLALALATLLYMTSQRLSLGDRGWWFAALGILAVAVVLALLPPGSPWQAIVPGFALACLLSPAAWRFYGMPAAAETPTTSDT